ncbi:NADH:flavin oxidoreductase/NADH oxidase [Futiania mangrovi]|uniref:NADH:flavin oxidoreductase/NADH oxidase n=1 Tax=Futiania mangrovi TaxID=2959716 RepID=A0A9J6PEH6_9PROT|nr:NADH:flavin oxidoreductase/NADH oxidase [Futiania mangrovii]MCP1337089.1 NADH:flavin oxidoreductase/NADH oxidase [Futiania mangrovii]
MVEAAEASQVRLFQAFAHRGVTLPNRIVISPMQQYAADPDGMVKDWHFVHLTKMAVGGAGLIFTEALAVEPAGRLTHADLGVWSDGHIPGLARLAEAMREHGSVPGAQLIHAGRKASMSRPWHGYLPLTEEDEKARGEAPWQTISSTATPANPGWHVPVALDRAGIGRVLDLFAQATRRVREAGFDVLDIHGAHGYLIHCFLSPLANERTDDYGGSLENRMRFAVEVADAVRSEWPSDKPLYYRLSCVDGIEGGWSIEDSVALSRVLAGHGVDVIDCSSGGLTQRATPAIIPREPGFQVPYADRIRHDAHIPTMAVGLITEPRHAEQILREGKADLIAIGRESLNNPQWALHAAQELGADPGFEKWAPQYGWWLYRRERARQAAEEASAGKGAGV